MSHCNGHRWSKFWWRDHQGDAALRACSLAARGYWMELLCIAHEATPVGHVLLNGKRPTPRQMAAIAGCTEAQVKRLENELEAAGVFDKLDDGTIVCRRMVRDEQVSEAGRAHIAKRWKDTEKSENPISPPTSTPISQPISVPSNQAYRHPNSDPITKKIEAESEDRKEERKERPLTPQAGRFVGDPLGFAEFWNAYPKKEAKPAAAKAYAHALTLTDADTLLAALDRNWGNRKYIPYPATWLNGQRWLDEIETGDPVLRAVMAANRSQPLAQPDGHASLLRIVQ